MPYLKIDPAVAQAAPAVTFGGPGVAADHPAGKSLSQMRTRLLFELGNRQGDASLTNPVLNEWINDAYIDMFSSMDLPESKGSFQITLTADQPLYLLPRGVDTIRAVSAAAADDDLAGGALQKIDIWSWRKMPIVDSTDPEYWFREGNVLVLYPAPDQADTLTVDINVKLALLAADTDYPILEDKWHEPLFKSAKYRAWEALQNDTKSLTTFNEASRLISRKKDTEAGDQADAYPSLRPITSQADLMALRRRNNRFRSRGDDC